MRRKWNFESGDFDSEMAETIRERIRNTAKNKGMTQKGLSAKTGYSGTQISRLLSGQRKLSSDHLEKLSLALEIPIPFFKKSKHSRQSDELFYDERLTRGENLKMAGILHEIKEGLVNYIIKKRRKKPEKEIG